MTSARLEIPGADEADLGLVKLATAVENLESASTALPASKGAVSSVHYGETNPSMATRATVAPGIEGKEFAPATGRPDVRADSYFSDISDMSR